MLERGYCYPIVHCICTTSLQGSKRYQPLCVHVDRHFSPSWCVLPPGRQVFNPDYTITNGVYLGSFPVLKFTGTFTWAEEKARLEFTFDQVKSEYLHGLV